MVDIKIFGVFLELADLFQTPLPCVWWLRTLLALLITRLSTFVVSTSQFRGRPRSRKTPRHTFVASVGSVIFWIFLDLAKLVSSVRLREKRV